MFQMQMRINQVRFPNALGSFSVVSVRCNGGEEGTGAVSGALCSRHYFWLNIKWILCKQVIIKEKGGQSGESAERGVVKIAGTVTGIERGKWRRREGFQA